MPSTMPFAAYTVYKVNELERKCKYIILLITIGQAGRVVSVVLGP